MLTNRQRRDFDQILEDIIEGLPEHYRQLLEEVPVVVEDEPSAELLEEMGLDPEEDDLCGLHTGTPLTDRSVEHAGDLPDQIQLFRGPILREAWEQGGDDPEEVVRQIRITLLHEMGHHFGLDEGDLEQLGYG